MNRRPHVCTILYKQEIAPNIIDMWVSCSGIWTEAFPGQFIHVKCPDEVLLRRPFAICDVNESKIRFVFEIVGNGTKALAKKNKGETINVLGPLGKGFTIGSMYKKPLIVGGGVGIFPLLFLCRRLDMPEVVLGFRSKGNVIMEDDFKRKCKKVYIATDDGSYGFKGNACDALKELISGHDIIYACGPKNMLKAVSDMAKELNIPCQVSIEEKMGCGIGACLACACKVNGEYKHVCKDGPVFWSTDLVDEVFDN